MLAPFCSHRAQSLQVTRLEPKQAQQGLGFLAPETVGRRRRFETRSESVREVRGPQGRVPTCLSTSGPECLGILVRNPAGVVLVEGFMWSPGSNKNKE